MKQLFNNHWYLIGIMIIIVLGIVLFSYIPTISSDDKHVGVVLGIVGVLATFIVVSNYAQVKDIEHKFMQETNKLKDDYNARVEEINLLRDSVEKNKTDYTNSNILLNEAIGNVSELYAVMNYDKGFYLNMIHNYIGAIKRFNLIDNHKANRDKILGNLELLLETINWNSYLFNDMQEINIFISDIQEMDFIDMAKKKQIIDQLKIINGIKISKQI